MANILISGGCGYIGSCLVPKLLVLGHHVTVYDTMWFGNHLEDHERLTIIKGDIRNINAVPMANKEIFIHLANIANDPCGDLDSKLTWEVNALATVMLAEKAKKERVKQFIYASSGSVYGISDSPQVTEDLPLLPISDYNKTKMVSERILLSYQNDFLIQIIRPATVCGFSPRQRLDVAVNLLTIQALDKKSITVLGGKQTRPNIHILDMVDVYLHFIGNSTITGIYNAGFENISIMDIAQMVSKKLSVEIEVKVSNDPRSYRQNSDKLISTGFLPKYGVKEGINDIVDAYERGLIHNNDSCYNIRAMKKIEKGISAF